ncbi:hypothetical protein B0T16DRAFT_106542 [Cercophora newfieldiana]|uniref:Uncharacterized protein n=1 Tax=Cercophora newfieldiana TaxID=92897 RepID=A0AA39YKU6_9PEZI|nr:hypothetical protein B0T16DRAFT_106542 [Cercophora newfieldiana]
MGLFQWSTLQLGNAHPFARQDDNLSLTKNQLLKCKHVQTERHAGHLGVPASGTVPRLTFMCNSRRATHPGLDCPPARKAQKPGPTSTKQGGARTGNMSSIQGFAILPLHHALLRPVARLPFSNEDLLRVAHLNEMSGNPSGTHRSKTGSLHSLTRSNEILGVGDPFVRSFVRSFVCHKIGIRTLLLKAPRVSSTSCLLRTVTS